MVHKAYRWWIGAAVVLLILLIAIPLLGKEEREPQAAPAFSLPGPEGFERAEGPRPFDFPADYGPHPGFQTEWWYYTGNLDDGDGHHFGYQLTFFRRALVPPDERLDRASRWGTDQVYMAHFALTDVTGRSHHAFERFSRDNPGMAGAASPPYRVWLEDWSVEETDPGVLQLRATQSTVSISLTLHDQKGPILQGDRGYSRKGQEPGNASYYFSQTRLVSEGIVETADGSYRVEGTSWMDHEYSTSALSVDQVGWDWFALQLDDGSEVILFQIRRTDGSIDPFSSGTYVGPDGETRPLGREDFGLTVNDTWHSPHSAATYPADWTLEIPDLGLTLHIEPYLPDQELNVSYSYWEGAVKIDGAKGDTPVSGAGYVEMTGYAASMQGQF